MNRLPDSRRPSRRARLGFAALLGAVALTVGAKAETGGSTRGVPIAAGGTTTAPSPSPSSSTASGTTGGSSPSSSASGGATAAPSRGSGSTSSTGTRTITGDAFDTRYGAVQVRVVLRGTKIVDVVAVQLPDRERRDVEINSYAVPQLRQEALAAQSASIDTVSGASYTSDGYTQSLQSALDRARG